MPGDRPKTCPRCAKQDLTSFSSCRFCGTKYDAVIPKQKGGVDNWLKLKLSIFAIAAFIVTWFLHGYNSLKDRELTSIRKNIQAVNRPRVIEFYSAHCPACRVFEPTFEQCRAKYSSTIDFEKLDANEKANGKLVIALFISAIPKTYIFNRKGDIVSEETGCVDMATLEKHLQDPELFK